MAYQYQQNLYGGAAEGYVKYNITPAPGTPIAPGEPVTVSGQAYCRDSAVYGVEVNFSVGDLWSDPSGYRYVTAAQKSVKISKGRTGAFSVSFSLTEEGVGLLGSGLARAFDAQITFMLAQNAAFTQGSETTASAQQQARLLKSRVAPGIESASLVDASGAAAVFGGFVQNESELVVNMRVTTDPLDATAAVAQRVLTLGGRTYALSSDAESIGRVDLSGDQPWTLRVTDSKGLSAEFSGTAAMLAYSPPEITRLSVERYAERTADDGTVSLVPADDGEHVRFSLSGAVCPVAGKNAWTLTAEWQDRSAQVRSGTDGGEIALENDMQAVTAVISAAERVEFAWTIRDSFRAVTMRVTADKAGAYFDVEKYGVSVGMRSSGTQFARKFEVAEDYSSHLGGGLYGKHGYGVDRCSLSRELTFVNTDFTSYDAAYTPRVSRVGALVFLDGLMKKLTAATINTAAVTIAHLPEWAHPATDVFMLHQGSKAAFFWLRITAAGDVQISRYREGADYGSTGANAQFPLTARWIAADAFDS